MQLGTLFLQIYIHHLSLLLCVYLFQSGSVKLHLDILQLFLLPLLVILLLSHLVLLSRFLLKQLF